MYRLLVYADDEADAPMALIVGAKDYTGILEKAVRDGEEVSGIKAYEFRINGLLVFRDEGMLEDFAIVPESRIRSQP